MKKKCLTALLYIFVLSGHAQVITKTASNALLSATGWQGGITVAKEKTIAPPVLPDGSKQTGNLKEGAYRLAWPVPVAVSVLQESGLRQTATANVYCLKITAPQATSLSINFDRFSLQTGAVMYIYNAARTEVTGPVTASENRADGFWGSDVYAGSSLYIEVSVPAGVPVTTTLNIGSILYGVATGETNSGTRFGLSGACNVNVNCPAGAEWNVEKNAVAACITVDGGVFSGVLLNNTCGNRAPYLLTAWHIAGAASAQPVSKWRFIFQYWSATCSPGQDGSQRMLFNGARELSSSTWSDFALMEMFQTPPDNSGIVYAGWDRSGRLPQNGTSLHHPAGDVMKISKDTKPVPFTPWPGIDVPAYWRTDWNIGVTEQGSSGAPLFDDSRRVIGQLRGGYSDCASSNQKDFFGAFSVSWVGNGLTGNRLSDWLDPVGRGAMTVNSIPANHYQVTGPAQFCNSGQYTISNVPPGAVVNWQPPVPAGIANFSVVDNEARLQWMKDGNVTLTATITLCGRTLTMVSNTIRVGAWPQSLQVNQVSCNEVAFNVQGGVPAATYEWTAGIGDLLLNGNAKKATTTVPGISATGSYGTMAVTTTNSCARTVDLYADYLPNRRTMQYGMAQPLINGDHIVASIDPVDGAYAYNWYLNDVLVQSSTLLTYCTCNNGNDYNLIVCGYNRLRVEVVSDCGTFELASDDRIEKACGNTVTTAMTLYPNPAADRVQVQQQPAGELKTSQGIRQVVIYDKFGKVLQQQRWSNKPTSVNVDVSGLMAGVYFMEVTDAQGHSVRKQLLIKR